MYSEENLPAPGAKTPVETEQTRSGSYFRPVVDILEHAEELTVFIDAPGANGDQIEVRFEDGTLSMHARVEPRHAGVPAFLVEEYGVGDYFRSFQVNERIDATRIHAEYADGVLAVHLPKVETLKPRRIDVKQG